MNSLTAKYTEAEMMQILNGLLCEGEHIETAVYCVYKEAGFFASNRQIIAGYAALTDMDRFIGYKMGLLNTAPLTLEMKYLTKIKISNSLLGQKNIYMAFDFGRKYAFKIQIAPKVVGSKFPDQERNTEIMLEKLGAKMSELSQ